MGRAEGAGRQLVRRGRRDLARRDPLGEVLAGQLSAHTRRAYRTDVGHLLVYLRGQQNGKVLEPGMWAAMPKAEREALLEQAWQDPREGLALLVGADRGDLVGYRAYLLEALGLSPATVNRRLSAARSILKELHMRGIRSDNPAEGVRGLRGSGDHSPTIGLTPEQAKALVEAPKGGDLQALRDRAILAVMVRNGLRAAEVVGLTIGDLGEDQGFRVATIRGKGDRTRSAKLAGPTWEALSAWLDAADRWDLGDGAPLFVPLRKQGRGEALQWVGTEKPLTTQGLALIVRKHSRRALPSEVAEKITPHSCRHSFVTIALEAGASLRRVQYAAGHADPRTTERYDRARENLSDNAADYVARAINGGTAEV